MRTHRPNWFVGLPVAAGAWFAALPAPPASTRLFAPDDLHITVAFLGAVGETAARRAFAQAAVWPKGSLPVQLGGVRAFGSKRQPSALSAVLGEGAEAVREAILAVRDASLEAAGAARDRRPPLPHVTLARIGRRARPDEHRAALAWAAALDLRTPRVCLDRCALYTWSSDRRSSLFRIVAAFDLQPLASTQMPPP